MPKELSDEQLDDIFDSEDDDFGSGLQDTNETPSKTETETPEGELESPEIEAEPEEAPLTLRSIFSERNVNLPDDADEAEVVGNLLDNYRQTAQQIQQMQAERAQFQQQLQHYQYMLAQRQQTQEPPPAQKPVEPTGLLAHWKTVPEWHDDWRSLVMRNEAGEIVARPGVDPTLPQKIEQRQKWEEKALRSMLDNPSQFVFEVLKNHPDFQQIQNSQSQYQQEFQAYQDKMEADRIATAREPYLFARDAQGQRIATQAGQVYIAAVNEATEAFQRKGVVPDSQTLDAIAWKAALPYALAAQEQAKKPVETPSEKKQKRQLDFSKSKAAQGSNKSRKRTPAPKFNGDIEAMDRYAIEQMKKAGIDPHELAEVR